MAGEIGRKVWNLGTARGARVAGYLHRGFGRQQGEEPNGLKLD